MGPRHRAVVTVRWDQLAESKLLTADSKDL